MRLWIDDVRKPPSAEYTWLYSTNQAITFIKHCHNMYKETHNPMWIIEVIDLDHDAGDFNDDGGDYINILKWLENKKWSYPIRIHSMNSVGRENMETIIDHNNWKEINED